MNTSTFSITTPCFNGGAFLEDAIQSVCRQKNVNVEHTRGDGEIAQTIHCLYCAHTFIFAGSRKQIEVSPMRSTKAFCGARGELLGWLNADDYYLPGGLEAIGGARSTAES